MGYLGALGKLIHETNRKLKILWHCPFNVWCEKCVAAQRYAAIWKQFIDFKWQKKSSLSIFRPPTEWGLHRFVWKSPRGNGNEPNFPMFSHNSGQHNSLRFWLQIREDIHNRKSTPRLGESGSRWLPASVSRGVADCPDRWVGESAIEFLKENSPHCKVPFRNY